MLLKKTHKTTTQQIIKAMVVVDILEGSVEVGRIFVISPSSSVVVSSLLVLSIFWVVSASKVLLSSVELPSVELSRTSGTRILKCSLSLNDFYFIRRRKFITNLMNILSHFNNVASLLHPGFVPFILQLAQEFCKLCRIALIGIIWKVKRWVKF